MWVVVVVVVFGGVVIALKVAVTLGDRLKVNVEASVPDAPPGPGPPGAFPVAVRAPAVSSPHQKQKAFSIVYQSGHSGGGL